MVVDFDLERTVGGSGESTSNCWVSVVTLRTPLETSSTPAPVISSPGSRSTERKGPEADGIADADVITDEIAGVPVLLVENQSDGGVSVFVRRVDGATRRFRYRDGALVDEAGPVGGRAGRPSRARTRGRLSSACRVTGSTGSPGASFTRTRRSTGRRTATERGANSGRRFWTGDPQERRWGKPARWPRWIRPRSTAGP